VLGTTGNEGEALATGLKQARAHFEKEKKLTKIMTQITAKNRLKEHQSTIPL
jgi:hypothetical protein